MSTRTDSLRVEDQPVEDQPVENPRPKSPRTIAAFVLEVAGLVAIPVILVYCALTTLDQSAALSMVVGVASLLLFFASYELDKPPLRETMPVVVLAALAAAGRIIFAPFPGVKPVSAICIIAGAVFGRKSGFMVGALAALVSNFFFGQGAWTPWQMYAWGLIGWLAGVLAASGAFKRQWPIYVFGAVAGLLYGFFLNMWSFIGFYHPQTIAELLVLWAAAIPFDITHSIATVAFLGVLWAPWHRKLERLKVRYGSTPS